MTGSRPIAKYPCFSSSGDCLMFRLLPDCACWLWIRSLARTGERAGRELLPRKGLKRSVLQTRSLCAKNNEYIFQGLDRGRASKKRYLQDPPSSMLLTKRQTLKNIFEESRRCLSDQARHCDASTDSCSLCEVTKPWCCFSVWTANRSFHFKAGYVKPAVFMGQSCFHVHFWCQGLWSLALA